VRCIDYLSTRDDFNKKELAVTGGGQGGALTLISRSARYAGGERRCHVRPQRHGVNFARKFKGKSVPASLTRCAPPVLFTPRSKFIPS